MSIEARDFYRSGPDHRQGQASNFALIRRQFDFRSIEIGRWVTSAERDRAAELFHDALCDLMLILHGPEALISLRGSLALQYGSGGRPGVSAHYDPSQRSFSLAKNAGPGSIAHEWFHAFDHYIAAKCFRKIPSAMFASTAWLADSSPIPHPLNQLLMQCFKAVLLQPEGDQPSVLFQHSVHMDKKLGQLYYSKPEELCARAFEAFVQDATTTNHFLVKGTKSSPEAEMGLYPQGEQRARINRAFGDYFARLGRALGREV
ncbi:CLCA_X family protein [Halovibrio sp. HP20-50]|uniref:CLCA_X family protein n=1 Tax=Halovibrio sp. HP20-59 TaxID=3080275 RepID=UPI00294AE44D|nr:CLCA_X family protein [Halovibrio sp. HP20-59]MEA2118219.1 CLCA_X family protein [Halovibrio sp. HP20-59]